MMGSRHVHVVEDEEPIRRSLHLMLRALGHDVQLFDSGSTFLATLPHLPRGCVLLDLRMPEVDGLEVQRRLTAAGAAQSVIVMSGHGDLGVAVAALEQGAVAFLEKPFSRAALQQALGCAFLRLEDAETYRSHLRAAAVAVQRLPSIERQVLELMARGHDASSIARQIGRSDMEVELARSRIFVELEVETVTEALHMAFAARRVALL